MGDDFKIEDLGEKTSMCFEYRKWDCKSHCKLRKIYDIEYKVKVW